MAMIRKDYYSLRIPSRIAIILFAGTLIAACGSATRRPESPDVHGFALVAAKYSLPALPCVPKNLGFFEAPGIDETLYASIEASSDCISTYIADLGLDGSSLVPIEALTASELQSLKWRGECPCTYYQRNVSDEWIVRASVGHLANGSSVLVLGAYLD
jgi:hypothetical protein